MTVVRTATVLLSACVHYGYGHHKPHPSHHAVPGQHR